MKADSHLGSSGSLLQIRIEGDQLVQVEKGTLIGEVLKDYGSMNFREIIAAKSNNLPVDLYTPLLEDASIYALSVDSPSGEDIIRHSASHIMAQAVKRLFPEVRIAIGPTIEDGFYYDFDLKDPLSLKDLEGIQEEMKRIIKEDNGFRREVLKRDEAVKLFKKLGETYKVEILEDIKEEEVSVYYNGDFVDLCRGPHIPSTRWVKAFKLLKTAGAYWRGDENRKMLQRIYGTAFSSHESLERHLAHLEEQKERDHRKLGKELDLFGIYEDIGGGLICWHPKGALIRNIIEDFWRREHLSHGYEILYTPHIAKAYLWETSGHLDFYKENMYSPMDIEGQEYFVKPMNCPFHILIYKSKKRSYRDLPIRWAELGTVYRYERGGVLHGLMRVRGFTQDDAHIFCRPDQLNGEIEDVIAFSLNMLKAFGFADYDVLLSTRPEEFVGEIGEWEDAESSLKDALEKRGMAYTIDEGGGAFYGPKIDIKIKDNLNRSWQCSTIQVDFSIPRRFQMVFTGEDDNPHRPVMIHRALLGSLERFFGIMIEHYGGAFPAWLAPVQAIVLNVSEKQMDYARDVLKRLNGEGIRAQGDLRNQKLGYKIREAQLNKVPYMCIIGNKEKESRGISPRRRSGEQLNLMKVEDFIQMLLEESRYPGGEL